MTTFYTGPGAGADCDDGGAVEAGDYSDDYSTYEDDGGCIHDDGPSSG